MCAVAYALFLSRAPPHGPQLKDPSSIVVPLIGVPREDFALRTAGPAAASPDCLLVLYWYTTVAAASRACRRVPGLFAHSVPVHRCRCCVQGLPPRPLTVCSQCTGTPPTPLCLGPDAASPDCLLVVHLYTAAAVVSRAYRRVP